jgi:saccharopine dehydrogenase-like NADP-dependent oxidoreductase
MQEGKKLKSKSKYKSVYICFRLSAEGNRLLSETIKRSGRKKIQEVSMRLEDHLRKFYAISEIGMTQKKKMKILKNNLSVIDL